MPTHIAILQMFDWQLMGEPKFVQFPIKRIKDNYQIEIQSITQN
ncbi:hypothetical protein [Okeania sp. SIO1I7]|nr:hypothetical protein [Okeania sp. SIO1I7]